MGNHPQMNELADEHGMTLHYGRKEKVTDHIHKWVTHDPDDREILFAECLWGWVENNFQKQCDATLTEKEIHRRLNATERLSAQGATDAATLIDMLNVWKKDLLKALRAYAAALEGEIAPR